jgi:hypothetical protein
MLYDQIYADFLGHCERMQPPGRWGRLAQYMDVWAPPKNSLATLAALHAMHSLEDLLQSGVVGYADTFRQHPHSANHPIVKTVSINSALGNPFAQTIPLRALPNSNPFDLVTLEGTVSGQLSACAMLHDYRTQRAPVGTQCETY